MSDRVAQMLARLPEQFKGLPNLEALIRSFGEEFQEIEDALIQLRDERSIDTAVGVQLEDIGNRVGEPPSGLDVEIYRRRIRARIATNRSKGRVEDLLRVARLILAETDGTIPRIELERQTHAHMVVRTPDDAMADDLADTLITFLHAAAKGAGSAGVRILLESSPYAHADRFNFSNGPGKGFAVRAGALLADPGYTQNVDTWVLARLSGTAGNAQTLEFVADGTGAGSFTDGLAAVFHFESGVTTVANFETAIAASEYLAVFIAGTGANVFTGGGDDDVGPMAMTGGLAGGKFSSVRE